MSRVLIFVATLLLEILNSDATQQSFTIYERPDFTGNFFTVARKTADLGNVVGFLQDSNSYCMNGWWSTYREVNYTAPSLKYDTLNTTKCYPFDFMSNIKSLRHLGPVNTSLPAISLYSEEGYHGDELIITDYTDPTTLQIDFHPQALFFTGHSNWTLFEGPWFTGTNSCYMSENEVDLVSSINYTEWGMSSIRSIRRGCSALGTVEGGYMSVDSVLGARNYFLKRAA